MLMRDSVFIEHFSHLRGDHVAIVGHGHERDFFPRFRRLLGCGRFRGLGWSFWGVSHK